MLFRQIFDEHLAQYSYLIGCPRTGAAIVVDPERDVDRYLALASANGLRLEAVTETHIHADFVSGTRELAARHTGIRVHLSAEGGEGWSYRWPEIDGRACTFLRDGDSIHVGNVELRAQHTPGHTPEHLVFHVIDHGGGADQPMALLAGDFVFVGDLGRPDLLEAAAGVVGAREPAARSLYASARRFLDLQEWLQVWPGHGAGSACGKALGAVPSTTVGYERRYSPALAAVRSGEGACVNFILEGQPEPPPYFARMKRWNRDGPPVLGELPRPRRLDGADLAGAAETAVALDTRRDRPAFFARHLRGSIFAPLNRTFPTIAGSYVEADEPVLLIVEPEQLEEAVRDLVRVGLDRIAGWAPADAVAGLPDSAVGSIPHLDFGDGFERALGEPGALVVDVRSAAEFEEGHVDDAVLMAHTRLAAEAAALPRDRPLLVYCETGSRSASAASYLARLGFDARFVDGRLDSWLRATA